MLEFFALRANRSWMNSDEFSILYRGPKAIHTMADDRPLFNEGDYVCHGGIAPSVPFAKARLFETAEKARKFFISISKPEWAHMFDVVPVRVQEPTDFSGLENAVFVKKSR